MVKKRIHQLMTGISLILLTIGMTGCEAIKVVDTNEPDRSATEQLAEDSTAEGGQEEEASVSELPSAPATEVVDRPIDEYDQISNQLEAWWFKRNDQHLPSGCQEDFDISQYHGYYVNHEAQDNVIYLTFDCGYENGYTAEILDTLKEQNVRAVFFVTQTYIRDNPELVIRMKEEGHFVGNHTITHPSLPGLSIEKQKEEIQGCAAYMKEATGYDMDPYIRPPKGEYSERTLQLCEDLGYCTIFWSMAYLDYEVDNQPTPDYVLQHFDKYCHPGAMPLLHNVSSANTKALPQLIINLREAGYRFGTIDEFCRFE
ncbi:MAG: polysaccharide deacetylase family protein [Clostridium sp.]|nr:polysaccharide deacetylase family protein [Clostridium sp.]MCM1534683.1 polysaccharide deacetylase family protein [Clostridium sp.]